MRLKAIPRSRAKTAWGLLQDVKRAILAEPKRVNMGVFIEDKLPEDGGPACGKVGCFAGWVSILAGAPDRYWSTTARNLLGPADYNTVGPGADVFNAGTGDRCETTRSGTAAHARAVVARINKFMRVNAKLLKARRLVLELGKLEPAAQ